MRIGRLELAKIVLVNMRDLAGFDRFQEPYQPVALLVPVFRAHNGPLSFVQSKSGGDRAPLTLVGAREFFVKLRQKVSKNLGLRLDAHVPCIGCEPPPMADGVCVNRQTAVTPRARDRRKQVCAN